MCWYPADVNVLLLLCSLLDFAVLFVQNLQYEEAAVHLNFGGKTLNQEYNLQAPGLTWGKTYSTLLAT